MKNFVFNRNEKGVLEFIGDFEGLYSEHADPWEQSGVGEGHNKFYDRARQQLVDAVLSLPLGNGEKGLEVGCGLGYVTNMLQNKVPFLSWEGADIANNAICKAKSIFPNLVFRTVDISSIDNNQEYRELCGGFGVIVLNQMLWYVLKDLDKVLDNCVRLIGKTGGFLIVSNGFSDSLEYGREIVDGFEGLVKFLLNREDDRLKLVKAEIDLQENNGLKSSIVVLRVVANEQ